MFNFDWALLLHPQSNLASIWFLLLIAYRATCIIHEVTFHLIPECVCTCKSICVQLSLRLLLEAGQQRKWLWFVLWAHRVWCINMAQTNTWRRMGRLRRAGRRMYSTKQKEERDSEKVVSQCLKRGGLRQKGGRLNWASSLKRNYLSISKLN